MNERRGGAWARFTRFVRGWFGPPTIQPRYSGELSFPALDFEALRADLDVDNMAAENGAANVPDQAQTQPDGQEQKIHHAIHQRVLEARRKTIQLADRIRASIQARQLAPAVKRCDDIPGDCRRELVNDGSGLKGDIETKVSIPRTQLVSSTRRQAYSTCLVGPPSRKTTCETLPCTCRRRWRSTEKIQGRIGGVELGHPYSDKH